MGGIMALSKRLLEEAKALGVDVTRYPGQKELRLAVRKALRDLDRDRATDSEIGLKCGTFHPRG